MLSRYAKHILQEFFEQTRAEEEEELCLVNTLKVPYRTYPNKALLKHFINQQMHKYIIVDIIKIIKYIKVLQRVSYHKGSIIREPYTALG